MAQIQTNFIIGANNLLPTKIPDWDAFKDDNNNHNYKYERNEDITIQIESVDIKKIDTQICNDIFYDIGLRFKPSHNLSYNDESTSFKDDDFSVTHAALKKNNITLGMIESHIGNEKIDNWDNKFITQSLLKKQTNQKFNGLNYKLGPFDIGIFNNGYYMLSFKSEIPIIGELQTVFLSEYKLNVDILPDLIYEDGVFQEDTNKEPDKVGEGPDFAQFYIGLNPKFIDKIDLLYYHYNLLYTGYGHKVADTIREVKNKKNKTMGIVGIANTLNYRFELSQLCFPKIKTLPDGNIYVDNTYSETALDVTLNMDISSYIGFNCDNYIKSDIEMKYNMWGNNDPLKGTTSDGIAYDFDNMQKPQKLDIISRTKVLTDI